ncbi:MAG: hypothetical protein ACRC9F_01930, partial [Metamycoplasmataceae bacterium]
MFVNIRKKWLENFFDNHKNTNGLSTNQIYTNELRSLSLVKSNTNTDIVKEEAATFVWEIKKLKSKNYNLSVEGKNKILKYQLLKSKRLFKDIVKNEKE